MGFSASGGNCMVFRFKILILKISKTDYGKNDIFFTIDITRNPFLGSVFQGFLACLYNLYA